MTIETQKSKSEPESEPKSDSVGENRSSSMYPMQPVTEGAYGGGLYGTKQGLAVDPTKAPASDQRSADGPADPKVEPKPHPPLSLLSGDRDVDITGQSCFQ